MSLRLHPNQGTIVICDFAGYREPEMTKRRPAVVVSPRFRQREGLCTIVPLSTTRPKSICQFHCQLEFDPVMPEPYNAAKMWVKADMICAVSLDRLRLPSVGQDGQGKRVYDVRHVSDEDFRRVQSCLLHGLGLGNLTERL